MKVSGIEVRGDNVNYYDIFQTLKSNNLAMVGYSIFTLVSESLISIVIHKIRTLNMKYDTQSKVTDVLKQISYIYWLLVQSQMCNL